MQVNVLETPDSLMKDFREMVDSVMVNPSPEKIKVLATNQAREINTMTNYNYQRDTPPVPMQPEFEQVPQQSVFP